MFPVSPAASVAWTPIVYDPIGREGARLDRDAEVAGDVGRVGRDGGRRVLGDRSRRSGRGCSGLDMSYRLMYTTLPNPDCSL